MPKDPKKGSNKRFEKLKETLEHQKGVRDPGALTASIGRKKLGEKKMTELAKKGKK